MKNRTIISITGKAGAGKTTICKYLCEKNHDAVYVDGDAFAEECLADHNVISRINDIVHRIIGRRMTAHEVAGALHKDDKISEYIFSLFIKEVEARMMAYIVNHAASNEVVLIDWFLIEKSKTLLMLADKKILIECPKEIRRKRVLERGNTKMTTFEKNEVSHEDKNKAIYDLIIDSTKDNWKEIVDQFLFGKEELISIIMPVYNGEKTIQRALESILHSTYKNLEVIVVDDGSTDHTTGIVEGLRETYSRIELVKANHGGVAAARNIGIGKAKGSYIGFVDADDAVEPNMFSELALNMVRYDVDVSSCRANVYKRDLGIIVKTPSSTEHVSVYSGRKECMKAFAEGGISIAVWDKLFKKEVLPLFMEKYFSEDSKFVWDTLVNHDGIKVAVTSKQLYHYMKHTGSLTSMEIIPKHMTISKFGDEAAEYIMDQFKDKELANLMIYNCNAHLIKLIMKAYRNGSIAISDEEIQDVLLKLKNLEAKTSEGINKNSRYNITNIVDILSGVYDKG